jgi:alpha-beta hydrolase superfamily lysophospholipase
MRKILRRISLSILALVVVASAIALITAPRALIDNASSVTPGDDLDSWIAARELAVQGRTPIVTGTGKRIVWADPVARSVTDTAVVYIHGFSASRGEIAPVPERVASRLSANLFETRLAGHGIRDQPLAGVHAEEWLEDAAEALAIGARLGNRIVIIATSTGATLTLAMSGREEMSNVAAIVMISPNFALPDPKAEILTWPGGPQFAQLSLGTMRSWTAANELQEQFWSTRYPTVALVEKMRLVQYTRGRPPLTLQADLLTLYSPRDTVVSADATLAALQRIGAPRNQHIAILDSADPGQHVLIGDVLSPQITDAAVDTIVSFLLEY